MSGTKTPDRDERNACRLIDATMDEWERTGTIDPERMETAWAHLRTCARCHARYSGILALESGLVRQSLLQGARKPSRPENLSDAILSRIREEPATAGAYRQSKRHSGLHLFRDSGVRWGQDRRSSHRILGVGALATAAVVVFVAGMTFNGFLSGVFRPDTVVVRFELTAPKAEEVTLVGDFNDWGANSIKLRDPDGDGVWELRVRLKRDVYLYNFVIDGGEWVTDPAADIQVDDGFGGKNSLMKL